MWEAEASSQIWRKLIKDVNPFVIQHEENESTRENAEDGKNVFRKCTSNSAWRGKPLGSHRGSALENGEGKTTRKHAFACACAGG